MRLLAAVLMGKLYLELLRRSNCYFIVLYGFLRTCLDKTGNEFTSFVRWNIDPDTMSTA